VLPPFPSQPFPPTPSTARMYIYFTVSLVNASARKASGTVSSYHEWQIIHKQQFADQDSSGK